VKLDVYCSRPPYVDHAALVWKALPAERRGRFVVVKRLEEQAKSLGIDPTIAPVDMGGRPTLIMSRADLKALPVDAPLIFMEHGVGANYGNKSHLPHDSRFDLVLTTPAQEKAHRAIYGDRVVVVGCPKLDRLTQGLRRRRGKPVIALSHHWDQKAHPETRSAWPWDKEAWERVAASGRYHILGHKHPGDPRAVEQWFTSIGAEFTPAFADVLQRADLYACDNSSTIYEFAAAGRPVLVLSPPFYRRDVDFGLRFWSDIPGVECANLDQLEACIAEALADVPERRRLRKRAVTAAYGPLDGQASQRAADAICAYLISGALPVPSVPEQSFRLGTAKPVEMDGVTYNVGDSVPRSVALEMKRRRLIRGTGL